MTMLWAAVLPAIFLISFIYKQDSVEKEPVGLIVKVCFWGALTCFSALILEELGDLILIDLMGLEAGGSLYNLLDAFLVVAAAEEAGKYLVFRKFIWKNPEFNYRFDAIVYAVTISLGFALLENIFYVFESGLGTAALRAVTAVPSHAINGVFMGYYFGQAKLCESFGYHVRAKRFRVYAFIAPVFLHGFYDFCAFEENPIANLAFFVFVVIIDVLAIKRIKKSSNEDLAIENSDESYM